MVLGQEGVMRIQDVDNEGGVTMNTSERSAMTEMRGQWRESEFQREDEETRAVSEHGQRSPQASSSLMLPTSLISSS